MREVLPDVFVVPADDRKGFGYSHFVRRDEGNVLLPRLKQVHLTESYEEIASKGGIRWALVSDRHFGGPGCLHVAKHFEATLVASEIEAGMMRCAVEKQLPYKRQVLAPGIEAIPTPGHTAGQMAYLVKAGRQRCLFTGDLAWREGDAWHVGNRSRKVMAAALSYLKDIEFDVYVGCAGYGDAASFVVIKDPPNAIGEVTEGILDACTRA